MRPGAVSTRSRLCPLTWPVAGSPILGTLFITAMALLLVGCSLRGVHLSMVMVPISVCLVMVAPPSLTGEIGTMQSEITAAYCVELGAVMAFGGLWGGLILLAATRVLRLPVMPADPLTNLGAWSYGTALIPTTAIAGFAILRWLPESAGAWVLLTLFIVIRPFADLTLVRAGHRVLGTVIGVVIAVGIALVITGGLAQFWIGVVLMVAAIAIYVSAPYWVYVAVLTPAVVLFGAAGPGTFSRDLDRLKFTLVGILLLAVAALINRVVGRLMFPRLHAEAKLARDAEPD